MPGNVIGFESINPQSLREMRKTSNLQGFCGYEREIQILRGYGLQTWAAFLVGHDADTPKSMYQTLDFAKRSKFTFAAFNILMPYPNTPLYERLRAKGRLLYDGAWWTHPDYRFNHAAFKPAQMTADELTKIAFDLRRRWNSFNSVVRRFFEPKTNMRSLYRAGIYWAYNSLFRREVFKKQGMRLGSQ